MEKYLQNQGSTTSLVSTEITNLSYCRGYCQYKERLKLRLLENEQIDKLSKFNFNCWVRQWGHHI